MLFFLASGFITLEPHLLALCPFSFLRLIFVPILNVSASLLADSDSSSSSSESEGAKALPPANKLQVQCNIKW